MPQARATALILAASGLERLELVPSLAAGSRHRLAGGLIAEALPPADFLPSAGQGGDWYLCCGQEDEQALAVAQAAEAQASRREVDAERSVLSALNANCHTAVAAFARLRDGAFVLSGTLADPSPRTGNGGSAPPPARFRDSPVA